MSTTLFELLLAGFFAIACLRACVPAVPGKLAIGDVFRFPGRLERLRRTRWQWFSIVALLLVFRLQAGVPLMVEVIIAAEFAVFVALPVRVKGTEAQRRANVAAVESR
jgi:hypothetical protein